MNLQALIFDSFYDKHRGVVAYIRIFGGTVKAGEQVYFLANNARAEVQEVGIFRPNMQAIDILNDGEVGYLITGMKELDKVKVGDTITNVNDQNLALPGYKIVEPKVFASIFTTSQDEYPKLRDSIEKLKLNDASLIFEPENIPALGFGFRCGFLGLLHLDIVKERLEREFDLDLIVTAPSVEYKILNNRNSETNSNSADPFDLLKTELYKEVTIENLKEIFERS